MVKEDKKEHIALLVKKLAELDEPEVDSYVTGYVEGRIDGRNAERERKHTVTV
jgi:hypothetical protein